MVSIATLSMLPALAMAQTVGLIDYREALHGVTEEDFNKVFNGTKKFQETQKQAINGDKDAQFNLG